MSSKLIATIIFSSLSVLATSYLETESNFLKPKLERNNVVNKGLWIRNKGSRNPTDFIFRANSLDVDKILQNSYDSFGTNVKSSPFFNSYVDRRKRSAKIADIQEPTTISYKRCKNNDCLKTNVNKSSMIKSKFISTLKPASVFNDYPYEVAVLLNNKEDPDSNLVQEKVSNHSQNLRGNNETEEIKQKYNGTTENVLNKDSLNIKKLPKSTIFDTNYQNHNITIPKRSMGRHDYETELIKKIEFIEDLNDTNIKLDRNVFDKADMEWRNTGPVPNVNVYKVLPKSKDFNNNKPITERGLIKVLTLLTKTFKKIMKQHHDIKRIHNTISNLNDDFMKNIQDLTNKYEDINLKYLQIIKINKDINLAEIKQRDREIYFDNREKELSRNLLEFQNQQKKFLNQQKQFYTVQKLMLAQNEKINIKQNVIAKTQSEISHRQNNFARILKKAKQIYIDSKNWSSTKLNTNIVKPRIKPVIETIQPVKVFTTPAPLTTTEPVKINLFSIAPLSKIRNHDQNILDEIDEQPVDELIYKYYFNNTFIDELMKNKILATFMANEDSNMTNINKNKRKKQTNLHTTLLLPINKTNNATNNIRSKRWIKHDKHKKKLTSPIPPIRKSDKKKIADVGTKTNVNLKSMKNDPYVTMAENFCKEIGQNLNTQILKWCIEKALRRLQVVDLKVPLPIPPQIKKTEVVPTTVNSEKFKSTIPTLSTPGQKYDRQANSLKTTEASNSVMFFPDNEELENKIKEYELLPDPEGTVYFDGSLHASDIGYINKNSDLDSEGFSDIMPGLDSNSKVEVDPLALDLQAQRRANVHRINERILKMKMA